MWDGPKGRAEAAPSRRDKRDGARGEAGRFIDKTCKRRSNSMTGGASCRIALRSERTDIPTPFKEEEEEWPAAPGKWFLIAGRSSVQDRRMTRKCHQGGIVEL